MYTLPLSNPGFLKSIDESSVPVDGLVLYYDCGNPKSYIFPSGNWFDLSPNHNYGTFGGTVTFTRNFGGNMTFNSGWISLNNAPSLAGLQVPLTITGFFRPTSTPTFASIYACYTAITTSRLWSMVRLDTGQFMYYTSTAAGSFQSYASGITPSLNNWHFYAVTISGTLAVPVLTVYVDNIITTPTTLAALSSTPDTSVLPQIGRSNAGGEFFLGDIPITMIYNRALTSTEVYKIYNAHKGRFFLN